MALKLPSRTEVIKVIVSVDQALVWPEDKETRDQIWAEYLKTNDESLLQFAPGQEPTRFVMRKVLSYDQAARVQNAQTTMREGKVEFQMSFMMEEVRMALTDIENPDYVPLPDRIQYRRDSDGACSKEIIEGLHALGVVVDLYTARQNATASLSADLKKKSSL